jgi:transglutaminase-like putative cysteine protease/pimeloyl-ACP methyl ester carboxylesterase
MISSNLNSSCKKSQLSHYLGRLLLPALLVVASTMARAQTGISTTNHWWPESTEQALSHAETNRNELVKALREAPVTQREGLQFLLENMPQRDLQSLPAAFLLENLGLAYQAREESPWARSIPLEVFLNDVLPYASVTEQRDNWRKRLHEISTPLVKDCKTAADAAQRLNQKLFGIVNVKYSTERRRADQSPLESMESGIATCTGLSILLVDACRAVGVPARVVGTPLWANLRGNHTWVEIWDGDWHFTGACEPDPKGLDRGWFTHDASQALKDVPRHAIYASSFKKTGLAFPLVWARGVTNVSAVNVTERYTPKASPAEAGKMRLLVKVLDRPAGQRVAAKITVTDAAGSAARFEGTSRDESADLNDILPFQVVRGSIYEIRAERAGQTAVRTLATGTNAQELVVVTLSDTPVLTLPSQACYAPPPVTKALKAGDEKKLKKALTDFFTAPSEKQANWKFAGSLENLLRDNEPAVRRAAWETFRTAPIHTALQQDFATNQVRFDKHLSPYTVKTVGLRPKNGWALFIAMHGGGNTPKAVNDSQWRVMQRYYHDHPEAGGYLYVALRAPNDTWNGFYDDYVYPLIGNLIGEFLLFGDVDPNKVFIMGYSHGGYGAFAIGPKIPDRFAAVHASAGAPTDGETTGKTLRNTIFTYMIGEKDTAYGRIDRCKKFNESIQQLRGESTNSYPVVMQFIAGNGHTGLPDRDKINDMYPAVRNPVPRELTWLMTDTVVDNFFWLRVPKPAKNQEITALCRDNRLSVTVTNVAAASVLLDRRLIDFKKPVTLQFEGKTTTRKLQPSLKTLCETLQRRGDPELAFTAEIHLPIGSANQPGAMKTQPKTSNR